jgi:hypothetical protein
MAMLRGSDLQYISTVSQSESEILGPKERSMSKEVAALSEEKKGLQ